MDSSFWVDSYPFYGKASYNLRSSAVSSAVYEALILKFYKHSILEAKKPFGSMKGAENNTSKPF